jgi:hypothetical protein
MSEQDDTEYSVGFMKPPRHTQFKPGQSGNPHGRPKKTDTVADVLRKELNSRITVVKDGKTPAVADAPGNYQAEPESGSERR